MISFQINSDAVYGLPERSSNYMLENTLDGVPYRLFNVDKFPHKEFKKEGLYSSLPYITGHSVNHDESIMFINSAETWVDIGTCNSLGKNCQGRTVNFITESG